MIQTKRQTNGGSHEATAPPKKKARRTTNKKRTAAKAVVRKKRPGRLSILSEMPLDILLEIFSHLHPRDLLHIARTTKALRKVLMHRSSLGVWKNARMQLTGFPDCPPDLSDPEYASLAFERRCHFCDMGAMHVDWYLRARVCSKCQNKARWVSPWVTVHEVFPGREEEILALADVAFQPLYHWRQLVELYLPRLRKIVDHATSLQGHPEKLSEYREGLKIRAVEIEKHAKACIAWENSQASLRFSAEDDMKKQRREAVRKKLLDLGYSAEGIYQTNVENHVLVNKPQELTERGMLLQNMGSATFTSSGQFGIISKTVLLDILKAKG